MRTISSSAALAVAIGFANAALALGPDEEARALRAEIEATRSAFQARMDALEARLKQLEQSGAGEQPAAASPPVPSAPVATVAGVQTERLDRIERRLDRVENSASAPAEAPSPSVFNPQMSLVLAGSWNNLSQNPEDYVLQGFIPADEPSGPDSRGFSLGESEMTLSASIDPLFYGQATFAVTPDNEIETEEAFVRTTALPQGLTAQAGRFYSALGYVNGQHSHAWDFIDLPLVYGAMFGGQYQTEGGQMKWLAPLDTFVEVGLELGNGHQFPGDDDGNGVGAWTAFVSTGNDIGTSASWKAGLAYLHTDAQERSYDEPDPAQAGAYDPTEFSGDAGLWNGYLVYKWAPDGNSRSRNLKLQAEYIARTEDGTLTQQGSARTGTADYRSAQSGWYVQGVYQFVPDWRVGLRYDRLDSGSPRLGFGGGPLTAADFPTLASYDPQRTSVMLDYSPSEFSRLRLQYARDQNAPGVDDDQVFLQYLMSLGAHGAHQF